MSLFLGNLDSSFFNVNKDHDLYEQLIHLNMYKILYSLYKNILNLL
jgi:hypothetical protein